jgi:hypothetical protein
MIVWKAASYVKEGVLLVEIWLRNTFFTFMQKLTFTPPAITKPSGTALIAFAA